MPLTGYPESRMEWLISATGRVDYAGRRQHEVADVSLGQAPDALMLRWLRHPVRRRRRYAVDPCRLFSDGTTTFRPLGSGSGPLASLVKPPE